MQTKALLFFCALICLGCETLSPFVSDALWTQRRDMDKDGIPRPNDCNDRDPKIGSILFYQDLDQDGFGAGVAVSHCVKLPNTVTNNTDCDDMQKTVHPGAEEFCDNLDNDCNGATDDHVPNPTTWFEDADQDGYGNAQKTKHVCLQPVMHVALDTDCNDDDKTIHPLAPETCNEKDDDCDGATDEDVRIPCYVDNDKDGYGWNPSVYLACAPLPGDVTVGNDCEDNSFISHPNAKEICDDLDNNCDGITDESTATGAVMWYADLDEDDFGNTAVTKISCKKPDGYVETKGDCNDLLKTVYPGAKEICNEIDDDCDGKTDEGTLVTSYEDKDKDTFGAKNGVKVSCVMPFGYSENNLDCNDNDKTIHPEATDLCDNNMDENCDGITDNAIGASIVYEDKDKDGYGVSTVSIYACVTPTGFSAKDADCDDTDSKVSPSASELCEDLIDNDCNGVTDTDAILLTWYKDEDKDEYGNSSSSILSCKKPIGYVANASDCNDAIKSINPGAEEICNNGIDDNCDASPNQCLLKGVMEIANTEAIQFTGSENDEFGEAVTWCDVNQDGKLDLLVSASRKNANQGSVFIYLAPLTNNMNPSQEIIGPSGGFFGKSLICTETSSGPMLLVGSTGDKTGGSAAGALYLFKTNLAEVSSYTQAQAIWYGTGMNMTLGTQCQIVPDQNKDQLPDFYASAFGYKETTSAFTGASFVLSSASTGTSFLQNATSILVHGVKNDLGGSTITSGDYNKDGFLDLVMGAPLNDNIASDAGVVFVQLGPINGTANTTESVALYGSGSYDQFGSSLASGSSVNSTGSRDLIIGASSYSAGQNPGFVTVATWNGADPKKPFTKTVLSSSVSMDRLGYSVSAGFANTDTYGDVLVSAPGADDAGFNTGSVFLIYGPINKNGDIRKRADAQFNGTASGDQLGWNAQLTPDLTGDQVPDLLLLTKSSKPLRILFLVKGRGF